MIHGLQEVEAPKHFLLTPGADCRGERQVSKKQRHFLGKKNVTFVEVFFLLFVCEDENFFSLRNNFYLVAKCQCKNLFEKIANCPSVYPLCCVHETIALSMW